MTLGGAAQVVCSYNRPIYAPASHTMAFIPQCSPTRTYCF